MEVNGEIDNEIVALENELHTLQRLKSELQRMRDMLAYFRRDLGGMAVNQQLLADVNSTWAELASSASGISKKINK